jgi:hypothetical protein
MNTATARSAAPGAGACRPPRGSSLGYRPPSAFRGHVPAVPVCRRYTRGLRRFRSGCSCSRRPLRLRSGYAPRDDRAATGAKVRSGGFRRAACGARQKRPREAGAIPASGTGSERRPPGGHSLRCRHSRAAASAPPSLPSLAVPLRVRLGRAPRRKRRIGSLGARPLRERTPEGRQVASEAERGHPRAPGPGSPARMRRRIRGTER